MPSKKSVIIVFLLILLSILSSIVNSLTQISIEVPDPTTETGYRTETKTLDQLSPSEMQQHVGPQQMQSMTSEDIGASLQKGNFPDSRLNELTPDQVRGNEELLIGTPA